MIAGLLPELPILTILPLHQPPYRALFLARREGLVVTGKYNFDEWLFLPETQAALLPFTLDQVGNPLPSGLTLQMCSTTRTANSAEAEGMG